jgi:hypothetical protein
LTRLKKPGGPKVVEQTEKTPQKKPLLFVDIDIGDDEKDRITIFKGEKPEDLAKEFCMKHGFDESTEAMLIKQLHEKIDKVNKIVS